MTDSKTKVWQSAMLLVGASIGQAIVNLYQAAVKIVLVVNAGGVLEGTISDGDIRRSLLKGLGLVSPITTQQQLLNMAGRWRSMSMLHPGPCFAVTYRWAAILTSALVPSCGKD